jgi:GNAT superfamily N-acetyltransferase
MSTTAPAQRNCTLEPADLREQSQVDELLRQRKICGWKTRPSDMASWKERAEARATTLFWIKPTAQPDLRVGHISLDKVSEDPSSLNIADLFVLPEHRGGGIARAAFQAVEEMATTEPYGSKNCRTLLIDTLSRKYSDDEKMRLEYNQLTGVWPNPKGKTNEEWYGRMGYVTYKEEPLYPEIEGRPTSTQKLLLASFMKKEMR